MLQFQAFCLKLRAHLHFIYLLYAIPMVGIAVSYTPPFQNPDEPNHFARAEQVSRLELVPVFKYDADRSIHKSDSISTDENIIYPDNGGFGADRGIYAADSIFYPVEHLERVKLAPWMMKKAKDIKWSGGLTYINFGNTAIYPPVVYIMPAIGITLGKLFNITVLHTLYLSRALNGLLCITACFFALMMAKRSGLLMFIVLLFPMSIAMFASVSQDAILISCAFLLVAIIDNVEFGEAKNYGKWQLYTMIILLSIVGMAKPPYLLFAFVVLFLKMSPRLKTISIVVPFMVLFSWLFINHANFAIHFAPADLKVNAKLQVQHIFHDPLRFVKLFFQYDKAALTGIVYMFVGVLGWLDLLFPYPYYRNAYILLFIGIFISVRFGRQDRPLLKTALFGTAFITIIAIITAQYVTWTALDSPTLSGMQGRYLLPVYPFIALALAGSLTGDKLIKLKSVLVLIVLLFPIYTAGCMVVAYNARYY